MMWAVLTAAIKDFSAIAIKEHSRLVDLRQVLTSEQAMTFVGAVSAAVMKHVTDKGVQAAIGLELGQLLNRRPREVTVGAIAV